MAAIEIENVGQIAVPMDINNNGRIVDQTLFLCHGAGAQGQRFILPPNIELIHFTNPATNIHFDTADTIVSTVRNIPLVANIVHNEVRLHTDRYLRERLQRAADPIGFLGRDLEINVYPPGSIVPNYLLSLHDDNPIVDRMLGFYNPSISQLNMYEYIGEAGPPLSGKLDHVTNVFKGGFGLISNLGHLTHFISHVMQQVHVPGSVIRVYLVCCREGDPIGENTLMPGVFGLGAAARGGRKRKLRNRRRTRKTTKRRNRIRTRHCRR
jgi:hypothetical protein